MSEIWKIIEEFPNYSISRDGKVKHNRLNRLRNPEKTPYGYETITFKDNEGRTRQRFIHRLLAQAFIPNPENKPFIDHINRIKSDNRLENLRWVTTQENSYNIDVYERNKLGEKNIFYDKSHRGKQYVVSMKLNNKNERAYFETLEDAKAFRDGLEDLYS